MAELEFNLVKQLPSTIKEGAVYMCASDSSAFIKVGKNGNIVETVFDKEALMKIIEDNELVTAKALVDLDSRIKNTDSSLGEELKKITSQLNKFALVTDLIEVETVTARSLTDLDTRINAATVELDSKQPTLISGSNIKTINGESILGSGDIEIESGSEAMTAVTYSELKTLRDGGELIPGTHYRITDFVTTVHSDTGNARSANHPFDIIVVADDANKLNENARAIQHTGDTYFNECKLEAWELKYCLDNDSSMYYWADSNGKGVIYYMKDEWDNECPYDFKNVQYKRFKITSSSISSLVNTYIGMYWVGPGDGECEINVPSEAELDTEDFVWRYTFTLDGDDSTLNGGENGVYSNKIEKASGRGECGSCTVQNWPEQSALYNRLNNIVFDGTDCYSNTFGTGCGFNTFGKYCHSNTFGTNCIDNTFGDLCFDNIFGDNCYHNTFGNNCTDNIFEGSCYRNTFGKYCSNNTFGTGCADNTFGDVCVNNTLGAICIDNTFGYNCNYNIFGNGCTYNTFGRYGYSNTFGTSCSNNTFGNGTTSIDYCRYIMLDNGCSYLNIISSDTSANVSNYLQNVHIHLGVQEKTIIVPDRNLPYEIEYKATNSQEIILD